MVLCWIGIVALDILGSFDRGTSIAFGIGTLAVGIGVQTLLNPQVEVAHAVNVIESEGVGPGERFAGQVVGFLLVAAGLGIVALWTYFGVSNGF